MPANIRPSQVDCETLAHAVRHATLAHHRDAPAILSAALTGGADHQRPCACVERIFRASIAAAPDETSALLEMASALYPDCADTLGAALNNLDADGASLDGAGFGVGFGPGFPGAPGFTGSAPSGGLVLPPIAVTSVVNG